MPNGTMPTSHRKRISLGMAKRWRAVRREINRGERISWFNKRRPRHARAS